MESLKSLYNPIKSHDPQENVQSEKKESDDNKENPESETNGETEENATVKEGQKIGSLTPSSLDPEEQKNILEKSPTVDTPTAELQVQILNDKKTIKRLTNKIKELEILLEAEKSGTIGDEKGRIIEKLEKSIANLEQEIDKKEALIKELEKSLADLQSKHEVTFREKSEIETTYTETVEKDEARIKELEANLEEITKSLDAKEKLQATYREKIESLLHDKQELLDKVEYSEKNREQLSELVEQNKGNTGKKDKIYAKMLKMKDRKVHKLTAEVEKLRSADKSRQQTIDYFKNRIQILEKSGKECER